MRCPSVIPFVCTERLLCCLCCGDTFRASAVMLLLCRLLSAQWCTEPEFYDMSCAVVGEAARRGSQEAAHSWHTLMKPIPCICLMGAYESLSSVHAICLGFQVGGVVGGVVGGMEGRGRRVPRHSCRCILPTVLQMQAFLASHVHPEMDRVKLVCRACLALMP